MGWPDIPHSSHALKLPTFAALSLKVYFAFHLCMEVCKFSEEALWTQWESYYLTILIYGQRFCSGRKTILFSALKSVRYIWMLLWRKFNPPWCEKWRLRDNNLSFKLLMNCFWVNRKIVVLVLYIRSLLSSLSKHFQCCSKNLDCPSLWKAIHTVKAYFGHTVWTKCIISVCVWIS